MMSRTVCAAGSAAVMSAGPAVAEGEVVLPSAAQALFPCAGDGVPVPAEGAGELSAQWTVTLYPLFAVVVTSCGVLGTVAVAGVMTGGLLVWVGLVVFGPPLVPAAGGCP